MRPNASAIAMHLLRAVMQAADCDMLNREKPIIVTELLETRDWASATFEGEMHRLHLRIEGDKVAVAAMRARLDQQLPEQEIMLKGWFVADIIVEDRQDCTNHDEIIGNFLLDVNQHVTFSSHPIIVCALVLRD